MDDRLNQAPVDFHLVIPCFEESDRLPPYLNDLVGCLANKEYRTTILVVDDGSGLEEQSKLSGMTSVHRHRTNPVVDSLHIERNMGKGYAVRHGWRAGMTAKWLAFADADGATPAYEVVRLFDAVFRNNDSTRCYLGARVRMLGRSVERRWKRHVLGRIYATLVGVVINESIYDSQCGFKVIPVQAFAEVGEILHENRFAFDSELIAVLSHRGYRLEEVPIDWKDVAGSKVSLIKDSIRMVISLFLIRKRRRQGWSRIGVRENHKHGSP